MGNTNDNLQAAFAGESQASRKYTYFAEKADSEGNKQIAKLFRAAAEAETVHARNHLNVLEGIKTSKENLQAAISGENYEFTEMYPEFIKQAQSDENKRAQMSFNLANEVEQIHHDLYQKALQALESGTALEEKPYFVCQVCGNTVPGEAPDKCPICGAPRSKFKQID